MQSIFNVLALVLDSSELIMTQWWTLYKDNNHKEHHATTSLHDQQNCLVCIGALRKMMINLSVGNKNSSYVAYVFSAETNFKTIIVDCNCLYHSIFCWKQEKQLPCVCIFGRNKFQNDNRRLQLFVSMKKGRPEK